ncbi:MAG: hypothetical protein ACXAC2_18685 [Candidatus Kariarchaeaceae archaeon]
MFGKLRRFAKNSKATDDSVVLLDFVEGETVAQLLVRIGIKDDETGEFFVNNRVEEIDFVIPRDDSRVAIFPLGMHLLCGGQHLKADRIDEFKNPGLVTKHRLNPIQQSLEKSKTTQ